MQYINVFIYLNIFIQDKRISNIHRSSVKINVVSNIGDHFSKTKRKIACIGKSLQNNQHHLKSILKVQIIIYKNNIKHAE